MDHGNTYQGKLTLLFESASVSRCLAAEQGDHILSVHFHKAGLRSRQNNICVTTKSATEKRT